MSLLSEEQKEQARNEVFKALVAGPHSNNRVDLLYAMTEAWKSRDPQEINPSNQAAKILVRYEKYLKENNLPALKSGQSGGTGNDLLSTIKVALQSVATGLATVADVAVDVAKAEFTNEVPTTGSNISGLVESLVTGEGIPQTDTPSAEQSPETKAELAKENRLSEQAALMLTIEDILPKITNLDVETTESSVETITPERRIYKNFTTIRPNDKQVGHFFITNNFTKNDEMENFFSKLPPQVLSLLIPSIKMYKTFYPISFQNASKQQSLPPEEKDIKGYDWRIPFDDVPVSYKDETSEFVAGDVDKILSSNGSLHGVGIKSFSYNFRGTNPAEINTNIEASLELFFQNPSDLVKEIDVRFNDPRFQNKIKGNNYEPMTFSYSDLINQTSKYNSYAGYSNVFNESYYRIKVECGYADINKEILKDILINCGYSLEDVKAIRKAIAASRVTFYLTPYRHDINFNDDGTINLKIDFIASMDSMMTSLDADLFAITEESKSLLDMIKKYDNYFASKKQSTNAASEETRCQSPDQIKKNIEEFKQKYPDFANLTDEEIESQLQQTRKNIYNGIFNYLVGIEQLKGSSGASSTIRPRIYTALYKPQILGIKTKEEDNTTEQRLEAISSANQLIGVVPIEPPIQPLIEGEQKKSEDQADVAMKSLDEKIAERYKTDAEKGIYKIKFILLGDILDIALECLNNIKPDYLAPRIAIGGIPVGIPTKIKEKLNKYNILTDIREIFPNLADIPISFDLFQQFMIEHVVRPKKERYPILQFIKDIISDLLIPAISPNVFGQSAAINASIRFSTSYNTFPLINNQDPLSSYPPSVKNFPPIIDKNVISNLNLIKQQIGYLYKEGYNTLKAENEFSVSDVNYVFLTCTSRFPKKFDGIEENDIKQGVLHFRMGTDSGIVKRIAFKKADTPFLREMVARREGNSKGTTIRQVYNADVELYGNNIFRPGDYIYIHPNYIFTDKKLIDLEAKLGVGGYYLVTDIKTDISDMTFKTILKCVFQAHVEKQDKNKVKVVPINDTCPVSN